MTNERTNAELIKAIRDEDKGLGEHAMLSARLIHNAVTVMQAANLEWRIGKGSDVAMAWIENLLIDTDNIPEEEYEGAGDLTNAHDPDLYFRDNHLDGDLSPYQSRMAPLIDELERRMELLQKRMDLMTAERDHWKANHDSRVNAAKVLMDRTDMPLERVGAYKQYVAALEENQKLQADIERYVAINAELATELEKIREQKPCGRFVKIKHPERRVPRLDYDVDWYPGWKIGDLLDKELFVGTVVAKDAHNHSDLIAGVADKLGLPKDFGSRADDLQFWLDSPPAVPTHVIPEGDDFNGTTPHMIQCIESLVSMNDRGALAPHGLCGHSRTLLLASANRLRQQQAPAVPALSLQDEQGEFEKWLEMRFFERDYSQEYKEYCLEKHQHGDNYKTAWVDSAWSAWKARALLQSSEVHK